MMHPMIAQLPNTRIPEEIPKANMSTEINSHKPKLINIKLMELMKKPSVIKVFSANCDKVVNYATDSTGLAGHIKFVIAAIVMSSKMISKRYTPQ